MNRNEMLTARLERASNVSLLTTFAALTHRLHAADRKNRAEKSRDLRVQRDIVEEEILRRMK